MIYDSEQNGELKYRRDLRGMEKRRRKGMALLAKGFTQAEVARIVGVCRMSVLRWERLRKTNPDTAWKRRKLGRPLKVLCAHPENEELLHKIAH